MVLRGLSVSYCWKIAYLSNDMLLLKRETNSEKAKKCRGEANLRERERKKRKFCNSRIKTKHCTWLSDYFYLSVQFYLDNLK